MQVFSVKKSNHDFRIREAYRVLRTNIEFSGNDNKVILITSSTPSEGNSTVSFELAMSFAQNGRKTLLIDADTRKSVMRNRWRKGKIRYGLTHYLSGQNELTDVICVSDEPNFCMIFAGPVPPNPSELVGNKRFAKMIEDARNTFDMIIIDTPPIGSVIDAAVMSKFCDGGIFVIGSGDTSYKFARRSIEQLERVGCKIIGCVLNKVNIASNSYYGKYYGNYYGDDENTN